MARVDLSGVQEFDTHVIKKLQAWIILTDEYGKPSDKYADDFLYNFEVAIKNGNFIISQRDDLERAYAECTNPVYTGGADFYIDLSTWSKQYHGRNFKTAIQNFIKSWQPATNK